ncbi:MAG: DUF3570 domain-containing protein, partial [Methylococcales bacterium]
MVVTKTKKSATGNLSLQALTAAALALPGLLLPSVQAADEEVGFQYGHYQESDRQLVNVQSRFKPIEVDSLQSNLNIKLSDRIKFAFNFIQDTWSGASPISTAPLAFAGNRAEGIIAGATPYLQNNAVYFDKQFNPLSQDPLTGAFSKNQQLVHTLSSASPETRKQGDFKLGYEWDEAALDVGGGISVENDYESRFGSLAGRWDFNQKNTTVNLGLSYTNSDTSARLDHDAAPYVETSTFANQVQTYADGVKIVHGKRQDWATSLSVSQVLSKSALLEAGLGYTRSTGYLANPYKMMTVAFIDPTQTAIDNSLLGETRAFLEKRPNERNQWSTNLRYVQHISALDAAVHLDYRFFSDDWGINAHTFEADWAQPVGQGWMVTPRVRYYSQDAADFYQPYLISHQAANKVSVDSNGKLTTTPYNPKLLPSHYSSDHRLSGYGALSGGVTVSKQFAKGISLEAGAEYYSHAGDLKLGGGGEGRYADFNYYVVNAALKVDLSALSLRASADAHGHHQHHHGAHAPAGVMFDHLLNQSGDIMIGYRYMYGNQAGAMLQGSNTFSDQALVGQACKNQACYVAPDNMNMHMHMLDLMYAPTDWLTLMLMPQFVDMHMTLRSLNGAPGVDESTDPGTDAAIKHANHEHTTGGIGDTGMYALFKVFDTHQHHVHATIGLSAPTGDVGIKLRDSHRQELGFIHYGMQLGSGTWDFKPSLTYTGQLQDWSWGAQISGTTRLEDKSSSGFAFGDVLQNTAWGSYQMLNWLSASVRGLYTVQGRLKHQYQGTYHKIGPMDYPGSYGGRFWDVGFGLNAV